MYSNKRYHKQPITNIKDLQIEQKLELSHCSKSDSEVFIFSIYSGYSCNPSHVIISIIKWIHPSILCRNITLMETNHRSTRAYSYTFSWPTSPLGVNLGYTPWLTIFTFISIHIGLNRKGSRSNERGRGDLSIRRVGRKERGLDD